MVAITAEYLNTLQPRSKRYDITCEHRPGFVVRVQPNGSMVFKYRTKTFNQLEEAALGTEYHSACKAYIELSERRAYRIAKAKEAKTGIPATPSNLFAMIGFLDLQEQWLSEYVEPTLAPMTAKNYRQQLGQINDQVTLPRDITEDDARLLLKKALRIIGRGTPVQANRTLSCLNSMFKWAAENDLIKRSPLYAMPRHAETPLSRMLDSHEIGPYLKSLQGSNTDLDKVAALKLILLTGLRSGEVRAIREDWIDWDANTLVIPSDVTKNGSAHLVPLTQLAVRLLRLRVSLSRVGGRLFDSSAWGLRQASRRASQGAQVTMVGPHDLRRTHATICGKEGVDVDTISRILNHAAVGVTRRVYALYDFKKEKLAAYELVEAYLVSQGLVI